MWYLNESIKIEDLKGRILTKIDVNREENEILFEDLEGNKYKMYHYQSCCEEVYIEDICGDLNNLLNEPLIMAEEVTEEGNTEWGTYTWTFYKLATVKGYVTLRWYGTSNGYYSERVDLEKINEKLTK